MKFTHALAKLVLILAKKNLSHMIITDKDRYPSERHWLEKEDYVSPDAGTVEQEACPYCIVAKEIE